MLIQNISSLTSTQYLKWSTMKHATIKPGTHGITKGHEILNVTGKAEGDIIENVSRKDALSFIS